MAYILILVKNSKMIRKVWTREETIIALFLYCQIPFGQIYKSNREIIKFAQIIGRTPSALSLKMANLSSIDPTIRQSGMSHASKLDAEIFYEFKQNLSGLIGEVFKILNGLKDSNTYAYNILDEYKHMIPLGSSKKVTVKQRIGQDFFRQAVLASYDMQCCVTGLQNTKLLIASHIKPWCNASDLEKTNPANGLCLNSMHDALFDKGFMTLDDQYRVLLSSELRQVEMDLDTKDWLFKYEGTKIHLPTNKLFLPDKKFLEYHRESVFLG